MVIRTLYLNNDKQLPQADPSYWIIPHQQLVIMCYPAVKWLKTWLTIRRQYPCSGLPLIAASLEMRLQIPWYRKAQKFKHIPAKLGTEERQQLCTKNKRYPWGEHRDPNKSRTVKKLMLFQNGLENQQWQDSAWLRGKAFTSYTHT